MAHGPLVLRLNQGSTKKGGQQHHAHSAYVAVIIYHNFFNQNIFRFISKYSREQMLISVHCTACLFLKLPSRNFQLIQARSRSYLADIFKEKNNSTEKRIALKLIRLLIKRLSLRLTCLRLKRN